MADERKIVSGSYKEVPILFISSTVTGGRKKVTHSFVGRDTNYIEDLGGNPRGYSLDIVITDRAESDYFDYRDRIMALLEESASGDLVHPLYGRVSDVVALDYSISERIEEFGSAVITVNFGVSGNRGIPQSDGNLPAKIEQSAQVDQAAAVQTVAEEFEVSPRFSGNYASAIEAASAMVDAGNKAIQGIEDDSDEANELAAELGNLAANTLSLLNEPNRLAESIAAVFDGVGAVHSSQRATLDGYLSFFGFGGGNLPEKTTAGLIERANNQAVLDGCINACALFNAYSSAVNIDYQTELEIDEIAETLEAQYQLIVTSDTDQGIKNRLTDMRADVVAAFNDARITASKIITVPVRETSVRLLAFDYYGNDDNGFLIAELNGIQDANSISGEVKLVTV